MKILLIVLLGVSLTANAVLLVRTERQSFRSETAARSLPPPVDTPRPNTSGAVRPTMTPDIVALLTAKDPAALQQLRELGFSEKVIRALAEAQVNLRFRDRERALLKWTSGPFWKKNGAGPFNAVNYAATIALRREKEAALKKLLGPSYSPELSRSDLALANLPPDKVVRIREINEDYNVMLARANSFDVYGIFLRFPEDKEKQDYLNKEKRAELSQLLTSDELFEYDLRTSSTAASLRFQLTAFEPTEEEFREIFRLRQASEAQRRLSSTDVSTSTAENRRALEGQLDQQLKTVLGDRFSDYKQANEPDYRRFYQIATRLDLPRESIDEAQALKTSIEGRRQKLTTDPATKDPAARRQALEALAQDAEAGLRRILGESGYDAYRQAPGNFLQRLRPPPPPKQPGN